MGPDLEGTRSARSPSGGSAPRSSSRALKYA